MFAFAYCIAYTCSRTFANAYHYDALQVGLVLLSYGLGEFNSPSHDLLANCTIGAVGGSILGGRWSDRVLRRMKAKNGGQGRPEVRQPAFPLSQKHFFLRSRQQMRLESTKPAMLLMPLSCIAYGWLCEKRVHVAAVCTTLFLAGFFCM